MVFDRRTRRDVVNIAALGIGLGVLTKVEAVAAPAVPVVTQFAPIAAVAGPIIGAGIVIRSLRGLETVGGRAPIRRLPLRNQRVRRMF